jgi:hypothetical protein
MFWTVPLSIIRSFSLYTQQWYMSYSLQTACKQDQDGTSWSCSQCTHSNGYMQAVCKTVWHIPLLCVQWKTPDDGQRNYLKHIEFHSKNKFEKLVHLVGFIIRIYHYVRSHERPLLICCHQNNSVKNAHTYFWCKLFMWLAECAFIIGHVFRM